MKIRDIICFCTTVVIDMLFMGISIMESIAIGIILFMFMNAVNKYRYNKRLKHDHNRK